MIHTSKTAMPGAEVAARCHELCQIEANFRVSKTDLHTRPVFVWTDQRIQAHSEAFNQRHCPSPAYTVCWRTRVTKTQSSVVARTGIDPVTFRFSGGRSPN